MNNKPISDNTPLSDLASQGSVNDVQPASSAGLYASDMNKYYLDSSLEVKQQGVVAPSGGYDFVRPSKTFRGLSKNRAIAVSAIITLIVTGLTGASVLMLARNAPDKNLQSQIETQDISLTDAKSGGIPAELQGAEKSLLVNGDVITRGTLRVANNSFVTVIRTTPLTGNRDFILPDSSGTLCLDTNNCNNASLDQLNAANNLLNTLQAQLGQLEDYVGGINLTPTVPGAAGVSALNNQTGMVSIQGSVNRVSVNTAGGVITISTPQDLDANANVQFGSLRTNSITQTGAGNSVSISAGADSLTFTSNGRVFTLPNVGAGSQVICTSAVTCAAGGGEALLLAPGSAQTDSSANASIFINDIGGGNLIQIQHSGANRLLVNNNGDMTIAGNLTVQGLGTGFVRSDNGALSVVAAINLGSDVTGTLAVSRGGLGVTTLTNNGILVGRGAAAVETINPSGANQCLVTNAFGEPEFQACPGASGVASVNSINGAITLQGTSNQVTVNTVGSNITLSTPQNIHSGATPTFAGLTLTGMNGVVKATGGVLGTGNVNLTNEVTGVLPVASGGTGISTTPTNGQLLIGNTSTNGFSLTTLTAGGGITITNGNGSINISSPLAGLCIAGCASQDLSNLTGVNINTSLLPDPNHSVSLGSTVQPFQGLHINSTAGAQGFLITGANGTGSEVTLTLPTITGTFAMVQGDANTATAQTGHIRVSGSVISNRVIATILGSRDVVGSGTDTITIRSGNAGAGNSGNVLIDAGTASATTGVITLGGSNASAITIGRSGLAVQLPGGLNTNGASIATANGSLNLGTGTITSGQINGQTIDGLLATFTGDMWVQGNGIAVGSDANNTDGTVQFINSIGNSITLAVSSSVASNFTITLPTSLPGASACLTIDSGGQMGTQACGSGIGGAGDDDYLAVFTGGGAQLASSVIRQDLLTNPTNPLIFIEGSMILGAAGGTGGGLGFYDVEGSGNLVSIGAKGITSSYELLWPTELDTTGKCLSVGIGGQIEYFPCISGGGGGGGGSGVTADTATDGRLARWVDADNFEIGNSIILDNGSQVAIGGVIQVGSVLTVGSSNAFRVTNAGALTVAGIDNSSQSITGVSTFSASGLISTSANNQALAITGAPQNNAGQSLIHIGNAIVGGNNAANGGTYIGLNAPSSGAGSSADYMNFQANGISRFRVANNGSVTAGTYNDLALQANATGFQVTGGVDGRTLTVTANATINQSLSTTSAVSFASLTLTSALGVTSGGTGLSAGPNDDGQLLIGASNGTYSLATLTAGAGITINNNPGSIEIIASGSGTCAGCANQALGNLLNVAIAGDHLKPATAGAINLGASDKAFGDLYLSGTSGSAITNRFRITGVATGSRTINLPDLAAANQEFAIVQTTGGSTAQTGDINVSNSLISGVDVQTGRVVVNNTAPISTALVMASNNNAGFTGNLINLLYGEGVPATSRFSVSRTGDTTMAGALTVNGTGTSNFANSIQVAAGSIQAPTVNATTALTLGGVDINTAGTLSNVAYLNQNNTFSGANTFSSILTASSGANISGTATIGTLNVTNNGTIAGGQLTVGAAGVAGQLRLYNTQAGINARIGTVIVKNDLAQNTTYTLPDPGEANAEVCVKYGANNTNCTGIGGGLSGSGTAGAIAYFSAPGTLASSILSISANNIAIAQGANRSFYVAQSSAGVGYNLTIQAGQGASSGNQMGGDLLLQAGAGGGSGSQGEVIVRSTDASKAQAFSIQNSDSNRLLTADTSTNMRILIGTGTPSLATAGGSGSLYVTNSVEIAGRLLVTTTAGGGGSVDTDSGKVRYTGSFRNTKTLTLTPEFNGVIFEPDGSNNIGYINSGHDGTQRENYYVWTTNEASTQDYDMIVQIPLPSDFSDFAAGNPITINRWTSNTTNGTITAVLLDTAGATATNWNSCSITPGSASTWTTTANCAISGGTFSANGVITLRLKLSAQNAGTTRIGSIKIQYLSSF